MATAGARSRPLGSCLSLPKQQPSPPGEEDASENPSEDAAPRDMPLCVLAPKAVRIFTVEG